MSPQTLRSLRPALLLAVTLFCVIGVARADSVLGVPVTSISSTTQAVPNCPTLEGQVCYNPATGRMSFYIPLSSSYDGVYGTTLVPGGTAGTFADTGSGKANALTMFLMFAPVQMPVQTASLTFQFTDLDLKGVNDPANFFETVQFYSQAGSALTPQITTSGQSGTTPLAYVVTANSTTQTVYFSDVTSIVQDPFYVKLTFGSAYNTTGTNTPENLIATLNTTQRLPAPTPEPATLLLVGSGIASAALRSRRRK